MMDLVQKLFNNRAEVIQKLLEEKDSKFLVEKVVAKELMNKDEFTIENPWSQIRVIISLSPFASSKEECYEVTDIIIWGAQEKDILPMITEHQGYELAKRCLISNSFFESRMKERCERHGAPSPKFYRQIGQSCFKQAGRPEIGSHFDKWTLFLKELFV
jgi:hypothetical protein